MYPRWRLMQSPNLQHIHCQHLQCQHALELTLSDSRHVWLYHSNNRWFLQGQSHSQQTGHIVLYLCVIIIVNCLRIDIQFDQFYTWNMFRGLISLYMLFSYRFHISTYHNNHYIYYTLKCRLVLMDSHISTCSWSIPKALSTQWWKHEKRKAQARNTQTATIRF